MRKVQNVPQAVKIIMIILYAALIIGVIVSLAGCYSQKKAATQVDKAANSYPVQTAKQLREKWPCVPTIKNSDSTEYKKYQADLKAIEEYYAALTPSEPDKEDSSIYTDLDSCKYRFLIERNKLEQARAYIADLKKLCKDKPPIHDTVKIRDDADLFICNAEKDAIQKASDAELSKRDKMISDLTKTVKTKNWWLWKIGIGLLLCLGWIFLPLIIRLIKKV